ncbi:class I SAM-dependent methyltransferase [uncultured Maritimibacter sp.]|jgi:ubiquinone/menaquinone biosynthesis C-methylase UbiE|uniref:class I SAM-dependent methyltransferase n=1 Tax=uncultured Maritimibacter sp. TaxID=991866 RepID=UPI000A5C4CCC|nr:class I SAM-dependent methyltransferase [uncultured Maritimibacter sp.]
MSAQTETAARAQASADLSSTAVENRREALKADWNAYAASYDLLSLYNPAYQDLLSEFENILPQVGQPAVIYDVGGGTGNYSRILARSFPDSTIHLLEPDDGMRAMARQKLSEHDNVVYIDRPFQDLGPLDAAGLPKADFVVCAHALYAMPDQHARLDELRDLLKPGGMMFLLDLGRLMDVSDWRSYLFSHLIKEVGLAKALHIFWQGRQIAKQNKAIFKAQQDNTYWTHSETEIAAAVEQAGFEILTQKTVYRGYSDLLLCRAAPLRRN